MDLLRRTNKKNKSGHKGVYGMFLCPYCDDESEKMVSHGLVQKSCGCIDFKITHGESKSTIYRVWEGIKQRCLNKKDTGYKYYGGRGIGICKEWLIYEEFARWARSNWKGDGLKLDRKDNDGDYCPENCRFVTHEKNMQNSRVAKLSWEEVRKIRKLHNTGCYTHKDLSCIFNIATSSIFRIVNNLGWTED